MNGKINLFLGLCLICIAGSACGITTWQGETTGYWDVRSNWAGGFPVSNSTVRLNHDNQSNAYTVIVRTPAIADQLWIDTYADVPVHVRVDSPGSLHFYSMRMGFKAEDRESSFTIDGGSVWGLDPIDPSITNTSFLVGNNPGCTATLSVLNSGLLSVQGSNGLIVASSKESIGRLIVTNGTIQIKDSLILGQGPGSNGEMTIAGASSVSITGTLHIAKLNDGAIMPTGTVSMAEGTLECGTLNIGAHGKASLTLNSGDIHAGTGGITIGLSDADGQLNIHGGTLQTTDSFMNIGHADSSGLLSISNGMINISGSISVGSGSRGVGQIDQSGGSLSASQLIIGDAISASGTLNLYGGALTTTNLLIGLGGTAQCNLYGGELLIQGIDNTALQISNSCINLQQTMIQWANSNVTDWVTNAVNTGTICYSDGFAPGTYSSNGFDGQLVDGDSVLYWDNLDNGSQFGHSAIWVEQLSAAFLYDTWTTEYELAEIDAELTADPDIDGRDNLTEYGLGGNPTNANDVGILPTFGIVEVGETNGLEYVYRQRSDAAARGLEYFLELNTNLVDGVWTNSGYGVTGIGEIDAAFEAVTNLVPTAPLATRFIRLRIKSQ